MTADVKLARGIDRLIDVVGGVFAWSSFLLVVVMATNVLLRYLFSTSVWAQELEWHLLVPLSLIGIAYAARHGEHVRVDIFFARYPDRVKHLIEPRRPCALRRDRAARRHAELALRDADLDAQRRLSEPRRH